MQHEFMSGDALNRLLYGNVLDAYDSRAFGADVGRSEAGKERLRRLAELNQKELTAGLSSAEKSEQADLRAMMPTARTVSEEDIAND